MVSPIGVTPTLLNVLMYMITEDEKKKKVEWYPLKNGFKELAQLVGAIAKPTAQS